LEKIYNVDVSPDLISRVTNAVLDEVSPPKVAQSGRAVRWKNHTRYCILAHYGLKAVKTGRTLVRVHMVRNSTKFIRGEGLIPESSLREITSGRFFSVLNPRPIPYENNIPRHIWRRPFRARLLISYKDLKKVCVDLKAVYTANSEAAARDALEDSGKKWDDKYPMIYKSWDQHWDDLSEFFKYQPEIRRTKGSRAIYTINAVESLNYQLRKVTKNRPSFPTDAIFKILYLAIRNASQKWTIPIRDWGRALNRFATEFGKEQVPFL